MSDSRQSLLEAALSAFNQVGYEATTVAAVCKSSGVSNGSFFHHFGSKEGLAGALFLDAIRSYHSELLAELVSDPNASEGICRLVAAHLRWVASHRDQAHFMFAQTRAEWMRTIQALQQSENEKFAQSVEAWLMPLIEKGELAGASALAFFSQVIGPGQILCRAWLASPDSADLNQHLEFLTQCAVRALVLQPSPINRKKQK